jgi:hypothetical protein
VTVNHSGTASTVALAYDVSGLSFVGPNQRVDLQIEAWPFDGIPLYIDISRSDPSYIWLNHLSCVGEWRCSVLMSDFTKHSTELLKKSWRAVDNGEGFVADIVSALETGVSYSFYRTKMLPIYN